MMAPMLTVVASAAYSSRLLYRELSVGGSSFCTQRRMPLHLDGLKRWICFTFHFLKHSIPAYDVGLFYSETRINHPKVTFHFS